MAHSKLSKVVRREGTEVRSFTPLV